MLDWIIQNKEWIFSGIGIVFISAVVSFFNRNRSKNSAIDNQTADMNTGHVFWEFHENGDFNKEKFDIFSNLPQTKKIDILVLHQGGLLKHLRNKIPQLLKSGLEIRLLYLKPGSETSMFLESKVEGRDVISSKIKVIETEISQTEIELGKLGKTKGSFTYRQYDWLPAVSLIVLTLFNNRKIVKVAVNPTYPNMPKECKERGRICLVFDSLINSLESTYYADAFEHLWNVSEKATDQQI